MENKQIKKATLCWKCKNAVPTKDAGSQCDAIRNDW